MKNGTDILVLSSNKGIYTQYVGKQGKIVGGVGRSSGDTRWLVVMPDHGMIVVYTSDMVKVEPQNIL